MSALKNFLIVSLVMGSISAFAGSLGQYKSEMDLISNVLLEKNSDIETSNIFKASSLNQLVLKLESMKGLPN